MNADEGLLDITFHDGLISLLAMKKINSTIEISELIVRDMSGQLDAMEKEYLEKWIRSSERNKKLYLQIMDGENLLMRNTQFESVDIEQAWDKFSKELNVHRSGRKLSILFRVAAAILIPVLIGITAYWYLNEGPQNVQQPISEIAPGTSNAVLVMANGKKVDLTNDSTKNIVENDGTVINNVNKELSYAEKLSKKAGNIIMNTLIVPQGGEYTVILSDGTRIFLNSMSKLIYPVSFTGAKREVTLEGEAFFEVTKDMSKPFIVTIKGFQIEVLGTKFNVKSYSDDDQSFTTLVEGKVKLHSGSQSSNLSYLEPDQQAVYDPFKGEIIVQKVDAKQFALWTVGKYVFTNQTLEEIMKTLSRWYDFDYQFEDEELKKIRFEGGLNKYDHIDPILDIINKTEKVNVSVTGKKVLFSKI